MPRETKLRELEELRARVRQLEAELAGARPGGEPAAGAERSRAWQTQGYYTAYYAISGAMLGIFGAVTSLLFNVIGTYVWSEFRGEELHPLRLIQVYLTFPLGEKALSIDSGMTLAIGSCLYIGTGMLYGMVFHVAQSRLLPQGGFVARFLLVSALSIVVWLVNFYGILSWLQPLLFGGNWIVDLIPPWVAALTHLVFGWTMVIVYPFGVYVPYRLQTERP
jgi:hypothetical protein